MRFRATPEDDPHRLAHPGRLEVTDERHVYVFFCSSVQEFKRAAGLLHHEAGTYNWLKGALEAGDVVYDIGANIGLYTILSGRHVGEEGHVYAFEPHAANVPSLMRNIAINDLSHVATPISLPLTDSSGYDTFVYDSLGAGNGTSGLSTARRGDDGSMQRELKATASIDGLLSQGLIRPPALVKIDLKGVLAVLRGMVHLLSSDVRPRSIQVETSNSDHDAVVSFMGSCNYAAVDVHLTGSGQRRASKGQHHVRNVVFEP